MGLDRGEIGSYLGLGLFNAAGGADSTAFCSKLHGEPDKIKQLCHDGSETVLGGGINCWAVTLGCNSGLFLFGGKSLAKKELEFSNLGKMRVFRLICQAAEL